ncbi:hypothetical protein CDL15_Pgr016934 [Punica granatum]|uniref:Uncharacterized protein n=1 Tax=Punica granatum TaxID=22663 RepID=A0A218WYB0_PUNGR|nr:hypothetical protein CDL15_Pgr016934 [Punica granatum]
MPLSRNNIPSLGFSRKAVRLDRIGGGLNSADRLDRGWAGELGRTDGCRAGRVGIGPRGALGRRKRWATEDFGPQTDWAERAGPVRSGSNTRLGGMGRADWVGSPLLDWAGPTRLGGTSERRGDGAGRRGRRRQVPPGLRRARDGRHGNWKSRGREDF